MYMLNYIYIYGSRFSYLSKCKIHNRSPHRPLSVLGNHLRPLRYTPPIELCRVQFESLQANFVGCGRNLNMLTSTSSVSYQRHKVLSCQLSSRGATPSYTFKAFQTQVFTFNLRGCQIYYGSNQLQAHILVEQTY